MNGPLTLDELKIVAMKKSHLIIRRDGETAWCPLIRWQGHAANATYYLTGSKVLVRREIDERVFWYFLG